MKRTKKLLYVPGLISLIGLLFALPSFNKKIVPVKEYCLPLFVPSDRYSDDGFVNMFSKYKLEKDISKKRKLRFSLEENSRENSKKMSILRYEALKLKYTYDTTNVILITLSENTSYSDFVKIVDMCYYDNRKRFAAWDNKFVIFGEYPPKKKEVSNSLSFFCCDVIWTNKPINKTGFFVLLSKKLKAYY